MSEEKHTPLPWRVEDGTDLIWGKCDHDDCSTHGMGYPIVVGRTDSGSWNRMYPDADERMANAALIVRAVNSHADLVAALEAAEEYISVDTDIPAADAVLAQIRIALAKAKAHDSRCPHCLGICNPLPDGSGYCDKCQGTGHAKSKGGSQS